MVHRVYICSNMKSPFVIKQHDQLEGCVKANHITSSSTCPSLYVLQQQGQIQEGEQGWTMSRPTTTSYAGTNNFESSTTQNQEGENDENITRTDMAMLMAPATKTLRNKEVDWGPSVWEVNHLGLEKATRQ